MSRAPAYGSQPDIRSGRRLLVTPIFPTSIPFRTGLKNSPERQETAPLKLQFPITPFTNLFVLFRNGLLRPKR